MDIEVVDGTYCLAVTYSKKVTDEFGALGFAVTWRRGATGRRGSNAIDLMFILSRILDDFLAAYLRVNEAACEAR